MTHVTPSAARDLQSSPVIPSKARDLQFVVAFLVTLAACQEPRLPRETAAELQPYQAMLVVSDTAPAIGDTVRVALKLRLGGDTAVASFTARIAFDTLALRFLADASPNDGTLRAHNREGAVLRIAGAAVNGVTSGTLFSGSFVVRQRGALASLRAEFDEVHDVGSRDVRASVRPASSVLLEEAGR